MQPEIRLLTAFVCVAAHEVSRMFVFCSLGRLFSRLMTFLCACPCCMADMLLMLQGGVAG